MDNPEKTIVIDTAGESQPADMKGPLKTILYSRKRPDIVGFEIRPDLFEIQMIVIIGFVCQVHE